MEEKVLCVCQIPWGVTDLYTSPVRSSQLVSEPPFTHYSCWGIDHLKCKMVRFPVGGKFVVAPLLHATTDSIHRTAHLS